MVDKHLDHSFGMLAVSFQLLTWCTGSAEDLIFFIYPNYICNVDRDTKLLFLCVKNVFRAAKKCFS